MAGKGLYTFKIETYEGVPCLAVELGGQQVYIPLRDIQEAANYRSFQTMKTAPPETSTKKEIGGVKCDLSFDRLEWYAYILKRAIANREPMTAWDACASMMSHFEQVVGRATQEREDERQMDSTFR